MNDTLHYTRRLAVAAVLVGAILSPLAASAQSELNTSDASAFMGEWLVSLDTEFGAFDMDLSIMDQGGKVAISITAPDPAGGATAATEITDASKSGDDLVLNYEMDAQGQLIPISVTLSPDGDDLAAAFDFGGQFFADGGATRKAN
jgi:hypothetical protein